MEKRLIIAITLSIVVLLIFQRFIRPPVSAPTRVQQAPDIGLQTRGIKEELILPGPLSTAHRPPSLNEIETVYETDRFILTFTNIGGALKSIRLKEYDTLLVKDLESSFSTFSLISPLLDPNLPIAEYQLFKEPNKIIYQYETPQNIKIRKEYIFRNTNDYIELQLIIENPSGTSVSIDYTIIGPSRIELGTQMKGRNFIEMNASIDGKLVKKTKIKGDQQAVKGIVSWLALKNRYFTIAMKPSDATEGILIRQSNNRLTTGAIVKSRIVYPGSYIRDSYLLYIGPMIKSRLAALNLGLDEIVNYGFFGGISVFLLSILGAINSVVHNWGVSIIAVTILINIILFPLTKKSFHSMQKMQEIQPHMEKLRKLHKDNSQKLNKEMAELYRQYNVNPFGGCLPMLLQLPIFVAFYQALMRAIELKGAHFLWVKDLSAPDALFAFPQPLPFLGSHFNLLPIITVIVMFFQQRISTAHTGKHASSEMAKQQKFMAMFFPIFFGFILYSFPSGLVLYWLTNSSLMMAEQMLIRRRMK